MQHQHQLPEEQAGLETSERAIHASTTAASREFSPGAALNQAQSEDRQWRNERRGRASSWLRKASRWGLMAEAASRVCGYSGLLLGMLALLVALPLPPLAALVGMLALACLISAPLLLVFAWIVYVGLGAYARWAKHEAILDELPTRRPLLWPGAPRPK